MLLALYLSKILQRLCVRLRSLALLSVAAVVQVKSDAAVTSAALNPGDRQSLRRPQTDRLMSK